MKLLYIAALAALTVYAQDQKVAANTPKPAAVPSERALTETETLKLQLAAAKIQLLQDKYKVAELQKEIEPIAAEQNAVATAVCKSLGIPAELIQSQCSINTGTGQDGKPIIGADGKPVVARVWWNKPTQTSMRTPTTPSPTEAPGTK